MEPPDNKLNQSLDTSTMQLLLVPDGLSRARVVKNLVMLGLSFVFMFTSYQGLSIIQSSFNSAGGLGTAGLAVTYVGIVVSSLTVAPLVIGRLGPKRTMVTALTGYLVYVCANLYPHWGTIIPASVLLGLCGAPLWASVSVYTVRLADLYARASGADKSYGEKRVAPVFFGVFYTLFLSSYVWGNLITFLALSGPQGLAQNVTEFDRNLSCGYRFSSGAPANGDENEAEKPLMSQFYLMMACFIATGIVSILVMLFLVDRTDRDSDRRRFSLTELLDSVRAMLGHMTDPRQLLLVILTINVGLSQAFAVGDFTEGFVACSSGIAAVGGVMMCYGAGQVVAGLVFGQVAGLVGMTPVLIAAACVQVTLETLALFWQVTPEPAWMFYVFAIVWGLVDTAWISLMNALYGNYFADRTATAFSVYVFLSSVGNIIGFSYNKLLCIEQKLYVMLAVVSIGGVAFVISAIINHRMRPNGRVSDTEVKPNAREAESEQ